MKSIATVLICLLTATSPVFGQLNQDFVKTFHPPGSTGMPPGGAPDSNGQAALLDRINKLEALVTALQHENDVLKKKLGETKSK